MKEAEGAGLDGMQLLRERSHLKLERLTLLENKACHVHVIVVMCMSILSCEHTAPALGKRSSD